MSARQKETALRDASGSTIMAQSRVEMPPEITFDQVFRQAPSHKIQSSESWVSCFFVSIQRFENDRLIGSSLKVVIPAEAGIQSFLVFVFLFRFLDSGFSPE